MTFPFEKDIILENQRVLMRPLEPSDLNNLLTVATANDRMLQYSPMRVHSEELLSQFIAFVLSQKALQNWYPFAIFDKARNEYAGSTSFINISNPHKRLEIGATWLGNEFQRTGLNRNCKFLLLGFAFEELGVERVEFQTDERNTVSRTAMEKIGAQYEGVFRSHMSMPEGIRRNSVFYSIIKDDWPGVRKLIFESIRS